MAGNKVLVVEDDETLLEVLKYNLNKEGYNVLSALDGAKAVEVARAEKPELIILDIMLPELNGYEVCRILRKETTVPILMLTARTDEVDKVVGLELGADDYLTKPFSMRELIARIRAMLRRVEMMKSETKPQKGEPVSPVKAGEIEIDIMRHEVTNRGQVIELSPKEFDLLAFLIENCGHVFTRDFLLEKVWGYEYAGDSRTVDVHIRWLRQKLERNPAVPDYIKTVRGVGYKFEM
jgi:two-component system OmpR family response regulator